MWRPFYWARQVKRIDTATKGAYMVAVTVAESPIMTGNSCGGHIASVVS